LIASLAHPGGNVTGLSNNPSPEFWIKGVQLLKEAVPGINRIAVISESPNDRPPSIPGLTLLTYEIQNTNNQEDLNVIFSQIREDHADALFLFPIFNVVKYQNEIGDFIRSNHLPTMSQTKWQIQHGGALLFYFMDFFAMRRYAATYVAKIIKGAKPGELSVEQPSRFEFIVNLMTAREFGLTIPQSVVGFADQLIE
jgi:putative ABC transport system substrate-binding protein